VLVGSRNVLGVIVNVLGVNVLGRSSGVLVYAELGRRHARTQHAIRVHVGLAERKASERLLQIGERQAGIDERAERHVARDAGETIKIEDSRH
jgi:hypothetical protein